MTLNLLLRYIAVALWLVVIFAFSHQGSEVSSGQSSWVIEVVQQTTGVAATETVVRKGAHALVYAVLGVLLLGLLRGHGLALRKAALLAVGLAALYAVSDELHQAFVPGRSAEVGDVLLDTLAASLAVIVYVKIVLMKKQD